MAKLTADPCTGESSSKLPSNATFVLTANATGFDRPICKIKNFNCTNGIKAKIKRLNNHYIYELTFYSYLSLIVIVLGAQCHV